MTVLTCFVHLSHQLLVVGLYPQHRSRTDCADILLGVLPEQAILVLELPQFQEQLILLGDELLDFVVGLVQGLSQVVGGWHGCVLLSHQQGGRWHLYDAGSQLCR